MNILKLISTNLWTGTLRNAKSKSFSTNSVKYNTISMSYKIYDEKPQTDSEQPPLIIMHGLFGSKSNWNSLAKVFNKKTSPTRRIIAVDARNHGESTHTSEHNYYLLAEDVKALMKELNIKRAALLGHSMGGRAAMYFSLNYPEMIDKLIVVDISPVSTSPSLHSMPELFSTIQSVKLPNGMSSFQGKQAVDKQLRDNISDPDLRAFLLTNLKQQPDGSYGWRINIPALVENFNEHIANFPEISAEFMGPVLFVAGGESNFIQKSDHPKILQLFPNARFHEIPDAGHWVHSEKPTEFLQACIQFLNNKNI